MKQFLKNILIFLLPYILLAVPIDYFISFCLKHSNKHPGEYEVMNDIYSSKARCDVAIYGSSRAWVHIDPKVISDTLQETAYNFGIDGHNFWLQYMRHLEYLKHNNKPKQIILSVDLFTLQKRSDLYRPEQFLPFMLWNQNIEKYTSSYAGYTKADYYVPLIRYAGKLNALIMSLKMISKGFPDHRYRQRGFLGMDRKWNTDFEKAKKNKEKYHVKLDAGTIDLFEKFIKECKEMNTSLVLVYTPEYIEGQNFVSNRSTVMNIYKNFSLKYNLSFLDYSNNEICLDKNLFYNASHLNKTGAELFSKKLAHDLSIINAQSGIPLQSTN